MNSGHFGSDYVRADSTAATQLAQRRRHCVGPLLFRALLVRTFRVKIAHSTQSLRRLHSMRVAKMGIWLKCISIFQVGW